MDEIVRKLSNADKFTLAVGFTLSVVVLYWLYVANRFPKIDVSVSEKFTLERGGTNTRGGKFVFNPSRSEHLTSRDACVAPKDKVITQNRIDNSLVPSNLLDYAGRDDGNTFYNPIVA